MSDTSNSAKRVYALLREAKRANSNVLVRGVWAAVFEIDAENIPLIYARLVRLDQELGDTEKQIQSFESDCSLYLRHFSTLHGVVSPKNLDAHWGPTQDTLSEQALESLEFCSSVLDKKAPEKQLPDDDLDILRNQIREIVDLIANSSLPNSAKQILADIARSLQDALHEYRIRGVRGLREELYAVFARLERNMPAIAPEKDDSVVGRIFEYLKLWQVTTSAYLNTSQLAGSILPALLERVAGS